MLTLRKPLMLCYSLEVADRNSRGIVGYLKDRFRFYVTWPLVTGSSEQMWQPGMELPERRMAVRYSDSPAGMDNTFPSLSLITSALFTQATPTIVVKELQDARGICWFLGRISFFAVLGSHYHSLFSVACAGFISLATMKPQWVPSSIFKSVSISPAQMISYNLAIYIASYMVISPKFYFQHGHLQVREYVTISSWTLLEYPMFPGEPCGQLQRWNHWFQELSPSTHCLFYFPALYEMPLLLCRPSWNPWSHTQLSHPNPCSYGCCLGSQSCEANWEDWLPSEGTWRRWAWLLKYPHMLSPAELPMGCFEPGSWFC